MTECQRCGEHTETVSIGISGINLGQHCEDCIQRIRHSRVSGGRIERGIESDRWLK